MKKNPHLNHVWVLERDEYRALWKKSKIGFLGCAWSFFRQVQRGQFDAAFDLSLSNQFGFFLRAMGVNNRIGFRYKNRGKFLNRWLPLEGYCERPVADYQLGLLETLGWERGQSHRLHYIPDPAVLENARMMLKNLGLGMERPIIGIAPGGGASWGPNARYKQWSPAHFAKICRWLVKEGCCPLLLGGADDCAVAGEIVKLMGEDNPADMAGRCSVELSADLMTHCEFVVANDGGLLHLAAAQDVPTVSFFGPTDPKVYGPYPSSEKHLVLTRDFSCRPCYRNFRLPVCARGRQCLETLGVEEVVERIKIWREKAGVGKKDLYGTG